MDLFRYYLALFLLAAIPVPVLYWLIVHPLMPLWRRLGPACTYLFTALVILPVVAAALYFRHPLTARDLGTNYLLAAAGLALVGCAAALTIRVKREITLSTLVGLNEIRDRATTDSLVTTGIYSRIRHPRYVELALASLGLSLISNHAMVYVLFLLSLPGLLIVVFFEERELLHRYGAAYSEYCAEVPRFIPRRRQ